jgi:hypothetical protein
MLSGYKILSRRYVKILPPASRGFGVEAELTVHALELRMPTGEEMTAYAERPSGSVSKLDKTGIFVDSANFRERTGEAKGGFKLIPAVSQRRGPPGQAVKAGGSHPPARQPPRGLRMSAHLHKRGR